jgi:hypothetical protein
MSATNGQRARFHRNRKRRVVQRMRARAVLVALTQHYSDTAAVKPTTRPGPALTGR